MSERDRKPPMDSEIRDLIDRFGAKPGAEDEETQKPPHAREKRTPSASRNPLKTPSASRNPSKTPSAGKTRTPSAGKTRTPSVGAVEAAKRRKNQSRAVGAFVGFAALGLAVAAAVVASRPRVEVPEEVATGPRGPGVRVVTVTETPDAPAGPSIGGPRVVDARRVRELEALIERARAALGRGDIPIAREAIERAIQLAEDCGRSEEVLALAAEIEHAAFRSIAATPPPPPSREPEEGRPVAARPRPEDPVEPSEKPAPAETPRAGKEPAAPRPGQDAVERWPNGKIKRKHGTDAKGLPHGAWTEYDERGRVTLKAKYAHGELAGESVEFHPNGKARRIAHYERGKLHGRVAEGDVKGRIFLDQVWRSGELLYPKSRALIEERLAILGRAEVAEVSKAGAAFELTGHSIQAGQLRRLNQYRYLSDVGDDVVLDADQAEVCAAACRLLDVLGRLEHTPARPPGISDELWKHGYAGTSQSNLTQGIASNDLVDAWIFDSDRSNIDRVGHRRWCLNPPMKKTAFGWARYTKDQWGSMFSFDGSRQNVADYDLVAYPSRGLYPTAFIKGDAAWNVSLNVAKYQAPSPAGVRVTVCPTDEKLKKGPPLELTDVTVNTAGIGIPLCVIFRPVKAVTPGARYWVTVTGIKDMSGRDARIEYLVEFF